MKTARLMMTVLAAWAGMLWAATAQAGSLTPPGPPGSTMHTLEEIYQKLLDLEARMQGGGFAKPPEGMVLIPAGEYVKGDTLGEGQTDEQVLETDTVDAFYMDATEITKAKWDAVYSWAITNGYSFDNAGLGKDTNHPVHTVNWYDCVKWANARSEMEGATACYTATGQVYRSGTVVSPDCDWQVDGYRLPTEIECERAMRGGASNRRFPWSDPATISHALANYRANGHESYDDSDGESYHPEFEDGLNFPFTSPVASFAPNAYGLYDMAGNVQEWLWDLYSGDRRRRPGCWMGYASECRNSDRSYYPPGSTNNEMGFRLVRKAYP